MASGTRETGSGSKIETDSDGIPSWAPSWIFSPVKKIRGVVVGFVLSGIASVVGPIFSAIQLLFLGSQPASFAAPGETWGLADAPAALLGIAGSALSGLISGGFGALTGVIEAAIPQTPGPIEGIIASLVIVVLVVGIVRIGLPALEVGLEAVPVIGGPLSTLVGRLT